MICPKCKADQLFVLETRTSPDTVRRRRECLVCGNRFSTKEITIEDYEKLTAKLNILLGAYRAVMEGDKDGKDL